MKTCVYVFSGTGTSLAIAKTIAGFLGETEIRLIPGLMENSANNEIKAEAETVGFVFPNYFGGIPGMVKKFIGIINLDKASYIFSVVTAGGGQGYSLKFLEEELLKKGKKLNYGRYVRGISNYIVSWYYKFLIKTGKQRVEIFQCLEEKLKDISKDISCKKNELEKSKFIVYMVNRILTPKKISNDTRPWDRDFSAGTNCTGCRTCEKICQSRNIKMENNKPVFMHNCQRCMACIQYCPNEAILFRGEKLQGARFFHPDFPVGELTDCIDRGGC